jgi:hypothetical protein
MRSLREICNRVVAVTLCGIGFAARVERVTAHARPWILGSSRIWQRGSSKTRHKQIKHRVLAGAMVRAESKFPQTGWVDNAIGEYFGLTSPKVATVVDFLWQWMMPFAASALILICYHHWNTRQNRKKAGLDKSTVETDALVLVDRDQPVASRSMVKAATECFHFLIVWFAAR